MDVFFKKGGIFYNLREKKGCSEAKAWAKKGKIENRDWVEEEFMKCKNSISRYQTVYKLNYALNNFLGAINRDLVSPRHEI